MPSWPAHETDTAILELVNAHGRKWTMIARMLADQGRNLSAQDVKRRYRFLNEIENMDRRLEMPVLPGIDHFPLPNWIY